MTEINHDVARLEFITEKQRGRIEQLERQVFGFRTVIVVTALNLFFSFRPETFTSDAKLVAVLLLAIAFVPARWL